MASRLVFKGSVAVLLTRLEALKQALDDQPGRTDAVEFQYDRVLRAATKIEALLEGEAS